MANAARRLLRRIVGMSLHDMLVVGVPSLLLVGFAFWGTYQFVRPAPPSRLVFLTGAPDGGYYATAARYKDYIEANGIRLEIIQTAGAVDNLKRLLDTSIDADIGLVQTGVAVGKDTTGLVSLGVVFPEPVWLFYRGNKDIDSIADLRGKRVAVGGEGSGTRLLAMQLLEAHGIAGPPTELTPDSGLNAAGALADRKVDAAFVIGGAQSGAVWTLLYTPGLKIFNFSQAEAYARRFPALSVLTLPTGAIDLERNIPARDLKLIAPAAMLVARDDTHPALIDLALQAASEVHSAPGLFQKAGEFPAPTGVDIPLSKEAARFYKSGKPFLQRYLPFWAATLIDRLIIMLVPVIGILLPLFKLAPYVYSWRVRTRVFRYYGELKLLELQAQEHPESRKPEQWMRELDRIDEAANRTPTPTAFADQVYTLRAHVNMVRRALERRFASAADDASARAHASSP